jgi:hypothetical protein
VTPSHRLSASTSNWFRLDMWCAVIPHGSRWSRTHGAPPTRSICEVEESEGFTRKIEDVREAGVSLANALRGSPEVFDSTHPAGQWVPSGENLGHHPSLAFGELRLGRPSEGCRAEAAQPRRRTFLLVRAPPTCGSRGQAKIFAPNRHSPVDGGCRNLTLRVSRRLQNLHSSTAEHSSFRRRQRGIWIAVTHSCPNANASFTSSRRRSRRTSARSRPGRRTPLAFQGTQEPAEPGGARGSS